MDPGQIMGEHEAPGLSVECPLVSLLGIVVPESLPGAAPALVRQLHEGL